MRIFVSGTIAYDVILDFPGRFADHIDTEKIHVLSVSFLVNRVQKSIGGTAANIAFNLASLGLQAEVIGAVGKDGGELMRNFKSLGVGTGCVKVLKNRLTAAAYVMTDTNDNQISAFFVGAGSAPARLPKVRRQDWPIIAAADPKNMVALAKYYQKKKIRYIFDPGQQTVVLTKSQMQASVRGASIIIGNDYEVSQLFKKLGTGRLRATVFKTLGPRGSEIIFSDHRNLRVKAVRTHRAVDPTGAGDAYRAGLIKGLVLGFDFERAAQLASTTAVFAVEKYGTQNHKINYDIIKRRHNRYYKRKI